MLVPTSVKLNSKNYPDIQQLRESRNNNMSNISHSRREIKVIINQRRQIQEIFQSYRWAKQYVAKSKEALSIAALRSYKEP